MPKTTGKYSYKPYRCKECGHEKEIGTNHWGQCYPFCEICIRHTIWECLEEMPSGYEKPKDWKIVKLGDIVKIK